MLGCVNVVLNMKSSRSDIEVSANGLLVIRTKERSLLVNKS